MSDLYRSMLEQHKNHKIGYNKIIWLKENREDVCKKLDIKFVTSTDNLQ